MRLICDNCDTQFEGEIGSKCPNCDSNAVVECGETDDGEMFEIFINDLKEEKQKELLEFLGLKDAKEGNFDVFPIAEIPRGE
jgi:hypothetical protein